MSNNAKSSSSNHFYLLQNRKIYMNDCKQCSQADDSKATKSHLSAMNKISRDLFLYLQITFAGDPKEILRIFFF